LVNIAFPNIRPFQQQSLLLEELPQVAIECFIHSLFLLLNGLIAIICDKAPVSISMFVAIGESCIRTNLHAFLHEHYTTNPCFTANLTSPAMFRTPNF
jgi:hypothetical protein